MKQALQILRKDARRFAYEICVMAAISAVFAWATIVNELRAPELSTYLRMASAVLPIAWCNVIALLIHEEALTGDRRFWITRPYSPWSLFAAKAMFVVLFMSIPLTIAQCVILAAAGYQPAGYVASLLWVQFVLAGTTLAPAFALASLTRTLMQFVVTILGVGLGLVVLLLPFTDFGGHNTHAMYPSMGLAWAGGLAQNILLTAPVVVAIVLQWSTRRRAIAIGAGLAAFALLWFTVSGIGWAIGTSVQSRMFGQRGADSIALTLRAGDVTFDTLPDKGGVALSPRLRVIHIPPGDTVSPEIVEMTVERAGGERWRSGWGQVISSEADVFQADPSSDGTFPWWQRVVVDGGFYRRARQGPVTIRGSVWLMVNTRHAIDLPRGRTTALPADGRCMVSNVPRSPMSFADCLAPFHPPFNKVDFYISDYRGGTAISSTRLLSYWSSPLPADSQMSPLFSMSGGMVQAGGSFVVRRYKPSAYVRRFFEARNVRLP